MAKDIYVGIGGKARRAKSIYVGIGGKARKVKKIYVGVNNKARLAWENDPYSALPDSVSGTLYISYMTPRGTPASYEENLIFQKSNGFAAYGGGADVDLCDCTVMNCYLDLPSLGEHGSSMFDRVLLDVNTGHQLVLTKGSTGPSYSAAETSDGLTSALAVSSLSFTVSLV